MTDLTIRPVVPTDIAAITGIYGAAVTGGTASFEIDPPDETEMLRRMRAITEAGFPYLVAERAGRVVAYAYVSQFRPRPAYRFTVENSIYVAAEAHRGGVGRRLLRALIDAATANGYRQMIAGIGDSGHAPSIGLHRALGFTFCGVVHSVGYKHGRWLDFVLMQLPLGEADTAPPS